MRSLGTPRKSSPLSPQLEENLNIATKTQHNPKKKKLHIFNLKIHTYLKIYME